MITKRDSIDTEKPIETTSTNLKRVKKSIPTKNKSTTPKFKNYTQGSLNFKNPESIFLNSESDNLIPFFAITDTMNQLEKSSGSGVKLKKKKLILELFNLALKYEPLSLGKLFMVFHCRVFPEYNDKDYGIGNSFLYKLISGVSGKKETTLKKEMKKVGDLGTLVSKYFPKTSSGMESTFSKMTFKFWFEQIQALSDISKILETFD